VKLKLKKTFTDIFIQYVPKMKSVWIHNHTEIINKIHKKMFNINWRWGDVSLNAADYAPEILLKLYNFGVI
jgi:hypothetical protein